MKKVILFLICILFLISVSYANIRYIGTVNQTGSVVQLKYDPNSSSYADAGVNPNTYLKLCADSAGELENKYVGYVYYADSTYVQLNSYFGGPFGNLLPVKSIDSDNCTMVDLDLSPTRAYYPGVPSVVVSNDNMLDPNDQFIYATINNSYLEGNYSLTIVDNSTHVLIDINSINYNTVGTISTIADAIVVAIVRNDTGAVLDTKIIAPNESAILSKGSYSGEVVVYINGLFYGNGGMPVPPPPPPTPGGGGGWGGGLLISRTCKGNVDIIHADTIAPNSFVYFSGDYCLDLKLKGLLVGKKLDDVNINITSKALSEVPYFDKSNAIAYKAFEISKKNIEDSDVKSTIFEFRVLKSWVKQKDISPATITIAKYDGLKWIDLDSKRASEDDRYYYFNLTSDSLSYYVIYGSKIDIWYVISVIDKYYQGKVSFLDVLDVILKYYSY